MIIATVTAELKHEGEEEPYSYVRKVCVDRDDHDALGQALASAIAGNVRPVVAEILFFSSFGVFLKLGFAYRTWSGEHDFEECVKLEVDWDKLKDNGEDEDETESEDKEK